MTTEALRQQLIRDEGLRLKPYRDTVGKLTIGVGRNLEDVGISAEEAEVLLANDLARVSTSVTTALPWVWELDEPRQGVLYNMAFNLGTRGLLEFRRMLRSLEAHEYHAAAAELLDSTYAGQVGARAQRLARQLETGVWQ